MVLPNWLQVWPPDDIIAFDYKFGHSMTVIASVTNLAKRGHIDRTPGTPGSDKNHSMTRFKGPTSVLLQEDVSRRSLLKT